MIGENLAPAWAVYTGLGTILLAIGGFWATTSWRLKEIERRIRMIERHLWGVAGENGDE